MLGSMPCAIRRPIGLRKSLQLRQVNKGPLFVAGRERKGCSTDGKTEYGSVDEYDGPKITVVGSATLFTLRSTELRLYGFDYLADPGIPESTCRVHIASVDRDSKFSQSSADGFHLCI